MAGVAYDGVSIDESIAGGYVKFQYRKWEYWYTDCDPIYDDEGNEIGQDCEDVYRWVYYSGTSDAILNGYVNASSNVYVNGNPIATTASTTSETWINSGIDTDGGELVSITPGYSGSGNGNVVFGNSRNVYANGSLVATEGSTVQTHIGTTTQISSGSSNVFIG